jgi:WD40 repeat protein
VQTTPVTEAVTLVAPARGVALRDELPVLATRMIGFSPDASYLLMPTGSSIDRYDATTMAFVDVLPCDRFPPDDTSRDAAIAEARSLATRFAAGACGDFGYSPDGTRAVEAGDAAVSVIDVASRTTLATLPLPGSAGYPAFGRYSPDGTLIMTWGIHATVAFDATTFEQRFVLEGDDAGPASVFTGLTFSDDSRLVAGASHDSAVVWDTSNGSQVLRVPAQKLVEGAVLSPDGALLAVSGRQGDNAVYDVASGTKIWEFDAEIHDIVGRDPSITYMAFSPDGHMLVVCYWNGTADVVRRYDLQG